jgi:hypothetical protein
MSCLLVLAASGDDFCLPRLLLPLTPPAPGMLPLDDPNTDFVEAPGPAVSQRVEGPRVGWPEGFCPAPSSRLAAGYPPVAVAFVYDHRASLPGLNSPLRC